MQPGVPYWGGRGRTAVLGKRRRSGVCPRLQWGAGSELRPLRSHLDSASCWQRRTDAGRQTRPPGGCRHLEGVCGHPAGEPRGRCSRAGGAAPPSPAPSRAESSGAETQERGETSETSGRTANTGSGPGPDAWTWPPRNPGGGGVLPRGLASRTRAFLASILSPAEVGVDAAARRAGAWFPRAHGAGAGRDQNLPPRALGSGQPQSHSRPSAYGGGGSRVPTFSGDRVEEEGGGGEGRRKVGIEGQWEAPR